MRSKLPLLPSGPGGVRKSTLHGPWRKRIKRRSSLSASNLSESFVAKGRARCSRRAVGLCIPERRAGDNTPCLQPVGWALTHQNQTPESGTVVPSLSVQVAAVEPCNFQIFCFCPKMFVRTGATSVCSRTVTSDDVDPGKTYPVLEPLLHYCSYIQLFRKKARGKKRSCQRSVVNCQLLVGAEDGPRERSVFSPQRREKKQPERLGVRARLTRGDQNVTRKNCWGLVTFVVQL